MVAGHSPSLVPIVVAVIAVVRMSMAPIPVLRLFLFPRPGIFVRLAVVFAEVLVPGSILVVIPVVIVPVTSVVDADLNAGFLWYRHGHD